MITIKTDKGLVEVVGWDQIESRPGFLADLDPTQHTLDSIVGRYAFKDKIRCGLSNCHTLHAKGYLVSTRDGCETNIGKDCGRTYFGVDFETLSRQFDRDIAAAENRAALWSFRFRQDDLEAKLAALRADGMNWVYQTSQSLLQINRGCPVEVVREVAKIVKARDGEVVRDREATEAEVQRMEGEQRRTITRPAYVTEVIAKVQGIDALYPEKRPALARHLGSGKGVRPGSQCRHRRDATRGAPVAGQVDRHRRHYLGARRVGHGHRAGIVTTAKPQAVGVRPQHRGQRGIKEVSGEAA